MIILVIGLAIWIFAHAFKRLAPGPRTMMAERMGAASKGLFAGILVLSVVLIVIGYRQTPFIPVYTPPLWGVHVMNLFMILAIALFGLGSSKSNFRGYTRHPQLWGFSLWAGLHLLVNGDLASVVLWGVFLLWALGEMQLITRTEPVWEPYEGGSTAGTIRLLAISLVLYGIITAIHAWLGVWPFPR